MKNSVYLAGPITGSSYDSTVNWRDTFKKNIDSRIICYSPMRFKTFLQNEKVIQANTNKYSNILTKSKSILSRDYFDVQRSDLIVVNFLGADKVSIGTVMELAWAFSMQKQIILITEEGNIHNHIMINEAVNYIVDSVEQAMQLVEFILLPD